MSGDRLRPPPSIWARHIPDIKHPGVRYPKLWEISLATVDLLRDTAGPEAKEAAEVLEEMMRSPLMSENLVAALRGFKHTDDDPFAGAELGHGKRTADRVRMRRASKKLNKMADQLLQLGDDLRLAAHAIEHREGAPTGSEVGRALSNAWSALHAVRVLAQKAERAAPPARGRQPVVGVRARLKLLTSVYRSYQRAGTRGPDTAFRTLFRALWVTLTGDEDLPDEQKLREHLRDKFAPTPIAAPPETDKS